MNNIVWVFGNSASGKETFINALIEGKAEKVITDLNLSGNKIVKINSSIKYIGQYENDPITKNRVLIITEAEEQLKNKDTTVLIKWQDVDAILKLPEILFHKYPKSRHIITYLHVDPDILWKRVNNKSWWKKGMTTKESFIKTWVEDQKRYAEKLISKGFEIYIVDSTNTNYSLVNLSLSEA